MSTRFIKRRTVVLLVLSFTILLILFGLWYKLTFSMEYVSTYEVNTNHNDKSILIATQGSEFKNRITDGLVQLFKGEAIYIKVMDIKGLMEVDTDHYDSIVILHTWEYWRPPKEVREFIKRSNSLENVIVLTTSGEGSYKMENVDALTGESNLENADYFVSKITERLKPVLNI